MTAWPLRPEELRRVTKALFLGVLLGWALGATVPPARAAVDGLGGERT